MNLLDKHKHEIKTYITIDYRDFDELIKEICDLKYFDFCSSVEAHNDSEYAFSVDGVISKFDLEEYQAWREENRYEGNPYMIMNIACAGNLIPKAEYLIKVSW